MYVTKWIKAGDYMFIKHYSSGRYGAPGMKRRKKEKTTTEQRAMQNNKKKAEKLQMLILANFNKGYHITLDYLMDSRPATYEEAEKNLTRFLDRMRRKYKKQNKEFKFIAITERGKRREALHHHMIVENQDGIIEDIAKEWGVKFHISKMYEAGAYKELAEYFVKVETKEEAQKGKSKYHRSRNLKKPFERKAIRSGSFKDDPEVPEGYELIGDTFINGYNELVNVRYQSYTVRKKAAAPKKKRKSDQKGNKKPPIWERLKNIFRKGKRNA